MQQLLYISSVRPELVATIDTAAILATSRRNNARENVTGLLFFDGRRFLQALEGAEEAVDSTFRRIQQDKRHRALVVLSRRTIASREFGAWAMDYRRPDEDGGRSLDALRALTAHAKASVRATFEGFAGLNRAA